MAYTSVSNKEDYADLSSARGSEESSIPMITPSNAADHGVHETRSRRARGARGWFQRMKAQLRNPMVLANIIMSQLLTASLYSQYRSWRREHDTNVHWKQVSMHSPLLERIDIPAVYRESYAQYQIGVGPQLFLEQPSDKVDEAWERLIAEHIFPIKESDIVAMRKDPSVAVKLPRKYDIDGEQAYMAKSSLFHDIHCLDYIRRTAYSAHYYPNGTHDVPFHDYHLAHCTMVLLEHLVCTGDPSFHVYQWMDTFDGPVTDTNVWRKCWDFETVLQEHARLSIHDLEDSELVKPRGQKSNPVPPKYLEYVEEENRKKEERKKKAGKMAAEKGEKKEEEKVIEKGHDMETS